MDLVISPYDITARSPAAMAAPLLAWPSGTALTLRPEPLEGAGRPEVSRAASTVAGLSRFLDSWRWTASLWREGLFSARTERAEPLQAVRALCTRIREEPALAPLRAVVSPELFEDTEMYLRALFRDLERGGGDPKVTLPVQAGLEAMAAELGWPLVRTHRPASRRASAPPAAFGFTVPMLSEADGDSVLELLHTLEPECAALDRALTRVADRVLATGTSAPNDLIADLRVAGEHYAEAFARATPTLRAHAAEAGDPFRICEAAITGELWRPGASLAVAARGFGRIAQSAIPRLAASAEPGLVRAESGPLLVLSVRKLPFDAASG